MVMEVSFCEYQMPLKAGLYNTKIFINEKHISNSPVSFTVEESVDPDKSYAEGSGLRIGADSQTFTVFALDHSGEAFPNTECKVIMSGPNGPIATTINNKKDGTFIVTYENPLLIPGEYIIDVLLNKQPIQKLYQ
eukprot:TRINITY_DN4580_c0_g1_i1.p1 TRINITY_DN4580_c0_g1~~TRINITY_DN4580_c0_g1_i1.p1  ORF type:complete len:135 (-),score=21.05 TRINITY_DN4580_c0_g1_i1:76-480(-)